MDEELPLYHLFERYGVELEYMIVDSHTLDVRPMTDVVLMELAGAYLTEVACGKVTYSNELALHVIELKTSQPVTTLAPLASDFQAHVQQLNALLLPHGAQLLPTAMHPWMDPHSEMRLWPHEQSPIYTAYDRIFDCRGHGWANLQSMHLNLPFVDDAEFASLHSAIRILLPLVPALAASSPLCEGVLSGLKDTRVEVYRHNQKRIPSIIGDIIPEPIATRAEYQERILQPMYNAIAPFDVEGELQEEWLNSRGAIARFDRNTIEIRLLDIQECPKADVAIAVALVHAIQGCMERRWSSLSANEISTALLKDILLRCVHHGEEAILTESDYLKYFGQAAPLTVGQLWKYILFQLLDTPPQELLTYVEALRYILQKGTLATRIEKSCTARPTREELRGIYAELAACLAEGKLYESGRHGLFPTP